MFNLGLNMRLGGKTKGGSSSVYTGKLLTSSSDGSGYAMYRKTGTGGFFVHVPIEDADDFTISLFPNTDYLYGISTEIGGVKYSLTRADDTDSGASQGYYYLVPENAPNQNTVWFELLGGDTLESFTILDEETYNIVGNEFFSPNYWTTFDKVKNPVTFGIAVTNVTHNGDIVTHNGAPITHTRSN